MVDYQIGDNLYADPTLKYYNLNNGNRSYVQSPYDVSQGNINSLYDAQQKSQLDALKAQRDTAIGQVNQQKQATSQEYYNQRNQTDVNLAKNVQRLREAMASNGLSASGENLTLNAQANSDRMNAFNTLNQQEQAKMNDYASQITEINNPAKDQAIVNAISTERSKALNDAFNQAQQDVYRREADWRDYQFKQQQIALQQQQMEMQRQAAAAAAARSSSGGSGRTSVASSAPKQKSASQSYNEALAYWGNQIDNVRNQGAYRVEQALRNDPAQIQALTDQGYDVNSVIDALYSSASNGQFKNKAAFNDFYNSLSKSTSKSNGHQSY
jgi:biotin operon repressor